MLAPPPLGYCDDTGQQSLTGLVKQYEWLWTRCSQPAGVDLNWTDWPSHGAAGLVASDHGSGQDGPGAAGGGANRSSNTAMFD